MSNHDTNKCTFDIYNLIKLLHVSASLFKLYNENAVTNITVALFKYIILLKIPF
jgi:hypothetical protein